MPATESELGAAENDKMQYAHGPPERATCAPVLFS